MKRNYYDLQRIILTVLVVLGHSCIMFTENGAFTPASGSSLAAAITDFVYIFHMPAFMCLNGMIFYKCIAGGKYKQFTGFVKNKFFRIALPYLIWGVFVVAVTMLVGLHGGNFFFNYLRNIVVSKDPRHLWYLLALFWIFIIAFFLKGLFLKKNYVIPVVLLALTLVLNIFAGKLPAVVQLTNTASYLFYFILGVYLEKLTGERELKLPLEVSLTVAFTGGLIAFYVTGYREIPAKICGVLAIFFICRLLSRSSFDFTGTSVGRTLVKSSFAVYLIHPMIIYLFYYKLGGYPVPGIVLALGVFVAAYLISLLVWFIFEKIHLGFTFGEKIKQK